MSSMKGFYRQRKNPINSKTKSSKANKSSKAAATFTSDVAQQPSLISRNDECNEAEAVLRQFDLNMVYGPCIGITRLARWERAQKLGLNPPEQIESLLNIGKVTQESLWDGRI